jgi:hypothetical protein
MASNHPLLNKPDSTPAIAASLTIAAIASIGLGFVLHLLAPPNGWYHGGDTPFTLDLKELFVLWTDTWSSTTSVSDIGSIAKLLLHLIYWPCSLLAERGVLTPFAIYFATAAVAGGACGRIVFKAVIKGLPPVRRVTTAIGSEPRYGKYGARHMNDAWLDRLVAEGKGIFLAPGVAMPRGVETEHVATIGTTGAGKSTIVDGLLLQGINRGNRALVVDVKGDAMGRFGSEHSVEISLGSQNKTIWRIGWDILNRQDAFELAAIMIPASKDPIWSDGARLYVTGIMVALQKTRGTDWGWTELKEYLAEPFETQEQLIRKHMPDIVQLLQTKDGVPTATVMSILVTVVANVGALAWTLAEAERSSGRGISLRAWARGTIVERVIFLRLEYDRENQSAALLKLALRCVQSTLLSVATANNVDHEIWIGLDELPRFCDEVTVERLVALGRSRGVRIVAALQTPAQLRKVVGDDATASLLANFGIQIVSRVAPGPGRVEIARQWFGERTVTWESAAAKGTSTPEEHDKIIPVLSENELSSRLGKFYSALGRPFIRAAVTGFEHVPILDWPVGWADRL